MPKKKGKRREESAPATTTDGFDDMLAELQAADTATTTTTTITITTTTSSTSSTSTSASSNATTTGTPDVTRNAQRLSTTGTSLKAMSYAKKVPEETIIQVYHRFSKRKETSMVI